MNSRDIKVSIVTPAYNSAITIGDTLRTVSMQGYEHIEHVIVDGKSTDETCDIVRASAPEAILISETDRGIYDAMNKGIVMATGDIVGVLNADDFYISQDVIADIVEVMMSEQSDALYGNLKYVRQKDTTVVVRKWRAGQFQKSKFMRGWMPPHPTFFVKKSIYQEYGLYRTDMRSAADYELMLRFLYKENVSVQYLDKFMVHMRTGGESNISVKNRLRANRDDRRAWTVNGLVPHFYTIPLKPIRKIIQFLDK